MAKKKGKKKKVTLFVINKGGYIYAVKTNGQMPAFLKKFDPKKRKREEFKIKK